MWQSQSRPADVKTSKSSPGLDWLKLPCRWPLFRNVGEIYEGMYNCIWGIHMSVWKDEDSLVWYPIFTLAAPTLRISTSAALLYPSRSLHSSNSVAKLGSSSMQGCLQSQSTRSIASAPIRWRWNVERRDSVTGLPVVGWGPLPPPPLAPPPVVPRLPGPWLAPGTWSVLAASTSPGHLLDPTGEWQYILLDKLSPAALVSLPRL